MEQNHETTSSVESVVVEVEEEDGASATSASSIIEEGETYPASATDQEIRGQYATEEQFQSVFSKTLVSFKLKSF